MDLNIFSDGQEYISAARASKKTGYASDYIGQLCRSQKIPGKLIGRTWFVDLKALIEHKENKAGKAEKKDARLNLAPKFAQPETFFKKSPLVYGIDNRSILPPLSRPVAITPARAKSKHIAMLGATLLLSSVMLATHIAFPGERLQRFAVGEYSSSLLTLAVESVDEVVSGDELSAVLKKLSVLAENAAIAIAETFPDKY